MEYFTNQDCLYSGLIGLLSARVDEYFSNDACTRGVDRQLVGRDVGPQGTGKGTSWSPPWVCSLTTKVDAGSPSLESTAGYFPCGTVVFVAPGGGRHLLQHMIALISRHISAPITTL